jgi:hypothetical protein
MKVNQMFPRKYATGEDLQGRAVSLSIQTVRAEKMRPGPGQPETEKWVLYFTNAQKGVILSRTLAKQIAEITGEDDTDNWEGRQVVLYPVAMQVAGRQVTAIRARAPQAAVNGNGNP